MTNINVLVTGGAGFIGKYTVNLLTENGYNPIVIDKKDKPNELHCQYYKMDVTSADVEKIFVENKIDYVIHLAALPSVALSIQNPMQDCKDNYLATVNICTLAKKYSVQKIIFSSTAAVYANPKYLPVDENHPLEFLSPYAISKNASENFIKYSGLDYIIFRYANVYGKGQDATGEAGVVAKFVDLMKQNKPIQIHGTGEQYRDFINVIDVAKVNVLSIQKDIKNEIINVSTNTKTTINELFKILKKELDYTLEPLYTKAREGDIDKSILDNKKLHAMIINQNCIDMAIGIKETLRG